jgi:hypothetical protein
MEWSMNDMPCGNTAALRDYQNDQELFDELDEAAKNDRITDFVVNDIQSNGDLSLEAIGTEALLADVRGLEPALKVLLVEAIECRHTPAQHQCNKELGAYILDSVFEHIGRNANV